MVKFDSVFEDSIALRIGLASDTLLLDLDKPSINRFSFGFGTFKLVSMFFEFETLLADFDNGCQAEFGIPGIGKPGIKSVIFGCNGLRTGFKLETLLTDFESGSTDEVESVEFDSKKVQFGFVTETFVADLERASVETW